MTMSKNKKILGVSSIAIFVVALAVMLIDWFVPLNLLFHPAANFAVVLFLGFGIMSLALAIKCKSPWFLFLSAVLVGLFALYVLLFVLLPDWWIAVVVTVAIWAIYAILSVTIFGNKTEAIALNNSPEYKNYEQRKAEKEEQELNKEEEVLPELKSFK